MKTLLLATGAIMLLAAGVAAANPLDDAKAGLKAFDAGDNQAAIRLFTSAIDSHRLIRSDEELAYVKLAEARLAVGENNGALADANHALDLQPSDPEAAAARDRARTLIDAPIGAAPPIGAKTPIEAAAPAGPAAAATAPTDYKAAMATYEAQRRADAEGYARELAAYDAEVAQQKKAREAELAAWRASARACATGDEAQCGGPPTSAKPAAEPVAAPAPKPAAAPKPAPKKAAAKAARESTPLPEPTMTIH